MKRLVFISIMLFVIGLNAQGIPITKDSKYYKAKGYQVFEKYKLAIKTPCFLEDGSNKVKENYDLHYGCFEQPFNGKNGAFYQIVINKLPAGYNNLTEKEKDKFQDEAILNNDRKTQIVYIEINDKAVKAYVFNYQNNGVNGRAILFFRGNYQYGFNIISNNKLIGRFNYLTNNIIFY